MTELTSFLVAPIYLLRNDEDKSLKIIFDIHFPSSFLTGRKLIKTFASLSPRKEIF